MTPPKQKKYFTHFWIEAAVDYVRSLGNVPLSQWEKLFFARFLIEATIANSGCLVMHNKYYAMIKTEQKLMCLG